MGGATSGEVGIAVLSGQPSARCEHQYRQTNSSSDFFPPWGIPRISLLNATKLHTCLGPVASSSRILKQKSAKAEKGFITEGQHHVPSTQSLMKIRTTTKVNLQLLKDEAEM